LDTPAARSSRHTSLPSIAKGSNGGDSGSVARHCSIGSLAADLARRRVVEEPGLTLTAAEFATLATEGVPYVGQLGCRVERFAPGEVAVRLPYHASLLRPGGTVCGPAMMALADITLYGVVLSLIGRVELAVTTELNIHFLAKARPGDLLATGRILRLGRVLAVGEVMIAGVDGGEPVAHATGTYAIPKTTG
jgi:uncharacterized protein (TIGR00369 family)